MSGDRLPSVWGEEYEVELLAIALWWLPPYERKSFYDMHESVRDHYRDRAHKLRSQYDMRRK